MTFRDRGIRVSALLLALTLTACSGDAQSGAAENESLSAAELAAAIVDVADGAQDTAITGTLVALDRGYSLGQIAEAAQVDSLDITMGAITDGDNFAEPENAATGFISGVPPLASAAAASGALVLVGYRAEKPIEEVGNIVATFLAIPPEAVIVGLSTEPAGSGAQEPAAAPDPVDLDSFHTALVLALIDAGYSVEQITEALVLGEGIDCAFQASLACVLKGIDPALTPPRVLDQDDPSAAPTAGESPVSAGGSWRGTIEYVDETVGFAPGDSSVEVVRDADGEFFMTASLTYTTSTSVCSFDWEKTFSGSGVLDPGSDRIVFEGTETTTNSSGCPDANLRDDTLETSVLVSVDGDTLSGVLLDGEFSATGTFVG